MVFYFLHLLKQLKNEIHYHIIPKKSVIEEATMKNSDPTAFSINDIGGGVSSDNYSFLDQGVEDLSAKGTGGMRQMHHYISVHDDDISIVTPPDNYEPNTIGDVSMEKLQQKRQNEIS